MSRETPEGSVSVNVDAPEETKLPQLQVLVREKNAITFFEGPFEKEGYKATRIATIENPVSLVSYSRDGNFFSASFESTVKVFDSSTYEVVSEIEAKGIKSVEMSPKGSFVVTFVAYEKNSGENLLVWCVKSKAVVAKFFQKNEADKDLVQWTADEKYMCHIVNNEVQIYDGTSPSSGVKSRLQLNKIKSYVLSPPTASGSSLVAVFVPGQGDKAGGVFIYDLAKPEKPTASRSFFRASEASIQWNALGTAVIVKASYDDDANGSYYGEGSHLFLIVADGSFDCNISFTDKGPVHDIRWSPRTYDFVTLQGEARNAKATVWAAKGCKPIKELGSGPWNTIRFSPSGRFIAVAGFGNLAGQIEIWDKNKLVRLGAFQDRDSPKCLEFSPCGRYILSGTMFPWLRVDNQFKIQTYSGEPVYSEKQEQLRQICWRPHPLNTYPDRPASPRVLERAQALGSGSSSTSTAAAKAPAASVYVPPHLRAQGATTTLSSMKQLQTANISTARDLTKQNKPQSQQQQQQQQGPGQRKIEIYSPAEQAARAYREQQEKMAKAGKRF